ncbi:uncharacterized protein [Cicer arietinum]|uniref:uncharacterized protein isoform X2 n=1 Tax=Cicer arietinum TaxID=3827 RepID=UPI003CC5CD68
MMSEKNYVLRVAGKLHRRFISYLTKFYLRDVDGNLNVEALKIYKDYISPKEWGAFVAKRADPAFVEARLNKDELVDNENVQQGIEQCGISFGVLYLSSPTYRMVGKGTLHNTLEEILNHNLILVDYVKVSPVIALEPDNDGDMKLLGEAIGS